MIKELIDHELDLLNEKAISYGRYKRGRISYGEFVLDFMEIEDKSSFNNSNTIQIYTMDWLIDQKTNDLPITSSGSTLNAMLDECSFIKALDGDNGLEDEVLSHRCQDYIMEEIDAIKTRIRNKLRATNSM